MVQVAREIGDEFGVQAIGVPADVSEASAIGAFVAVIEREFGGTDILINNAGTGYIDGGWLRVTT